MLLDAFKAWITGSRRITFNDFRDMQRVARDLNELLRKVLPIGPEIVDLMTFKDAVRYFVTERPASTLVRKGAMLRQPHPSGHLLVQVFLDEHNEFVHGPDDRPYGRRLVVKQFDHELLEAFGTDDLVVVE
jgi:hypothetical protein